jgi:DNA processing protein
VRADGDDLPVDLALPAGFPQGFGRSSREEWRAILLLRCLLGITPRTMREVAWRTGSAVATVEAIGRGEAGSDRDRAFLRGADATSISAQVAAAGARFAVPGDVEYWPAFERLEDPPVGVFLRGRPLALGHRRVAVVGSRRPSGLGADVARTLGRDLARAGAVVTSGGAIGIDARAHEGALDAGGTTVAVLGSGIDVLYPATNRRLLEEIAERGTVMSEYPPGVPAEPFRFPARNRIIAALSVAVVIVEGVARSGTRSTADFATQVGADVFAVPGPVTSPLSDAPHELIRDGARLIRGADDLLDDLGLESVRMPVSLDGLPRDEHAIYEALMEAMLPEAVAAAVRLPVDETVAALMRLEMRGLIRGTGGRYGRAVAKGEHGTDGLGPDATALAG